LEFCEAFRKIAKAAACEQFSLAMMIPSAWSITGRVASEARGCRRLPTVSDRNVPSPLRRPRETTTDPIPHVE
jgi:hypothetical protein